MSENFLAFSNGFKKRSSSTQQSATTKKLAFYSLIIARSMSYGIMILSCSVMKFII